MSELRNEFVEEVRNGEYGNSVMNELKDFLVEAHDEVKDLERKLEEAREVIKKIEDLATSYYCQKSEYEDSVEIPYWDIVFALNIKEQG